MKEIVYIIGHRSSDPFRIRNLLLVLKWLTNLKELLYDIKLTIAVIEQDSKPSINCLIDHDHIHYVFAYNSGFYNRGWIFNVGYKKFNKADYFYFADNDIIIDDIEICNVFRSCFKYDAVNPYSIIYDTKAKLFEDCNKDNKINFDLEHLEKNDYIKGKREYTCFSGGIVGLSKKAFEKIGGWDERFRGRGWEDYAFTSKIHLFLKKLNTFPSKAIHMWHPWEISTDRENNKVLNYEYCKYDVDDYIEIIKKNSLHCGCINKYIYEENEDHCGKYKSDEAIHNVYISKHQQCDHCGYEVNEDNKIMCKVNHHHYSNKVYDNLAILVKHKHKCESKEKRRVIIYYNLCEQHNCNSHNSHDNNLDGCDLSCIS